VSDFPSWVFVSIFYISDFPTSAFQKKDQMKRGRDSDGDNDVPDPKKRKLNMVIGSQSYSEGSSFLVYDQTPTEKKFFKMLEDVYKSKTRPMFDRKFLFDWTDDMVMAAHEVTEVSNKYAGNSVTRVSGKTCTPDILNLMDTYDKVKDKKMISGFIIDQIREGGCPYDNSWGKREQKNYLGTHADYVVQDDSLWEPTE